jgi:hypothetical protein
MIVLRVHITRMVLPIRFLRYGGKSITSANLYKIWNMMSLGSSIKKFRSPLWNENGTNNMIVSSSMYVTFVWKDHSKFKIEFFPWTGHNLNNYIHNESFPAK